MKVIYSGKTKDFTAELEEKISGKLAKLSKMIEQRGEREAHITHCVERHLHKVEVIVNFYDHSLVAEGADAELESALCHAVENLETKVIKLKNRWRDTHRDPKAVRSSKENWDADTAGKSAAPAGSPAAASAVRPGNGTANGKAHERPRIFRVDYNDGRKPMTLEEAMLEMETESDYLVYRDSDKNCLSVLVRRADGNYDLIES